MKTQSTLMGIYRLCLALWCFAFAAQCMDENIFRASQTQQGVQSTRRLMSLQRQQDDQIGDYDDLPRLRNREDQTDDEEEEEEVQDLPPLRDGEFFDLSAVAESVNSMANGFLNLGKGIIKGGVSLITVPVRIRAGEVSSIGQGGPTGTFHAENAVMPWLQQEEAQAGQSSDVPFSPSGQSVPPLTSFQDPTPRQILRKRPKVSQQSNNGIQMIIRQKNGLDEIKNLFLDVAFFNDNLLKIINELIPSDLGHYGMWGFNVEIESLRAIALQRPHDLVLDLTNRGIVSALKKCIFGAEIGLKIKLPLQRAFSLKYRFDFGFSFQSILVPYIRAQRMHADQGFFGHTTSNKMLVNVTVPEFKFETDLNLQLVSGGIWAKVITRLYSTVKGIVTYWIGQLLNYQFQKIIREDLTEEMDKFVNSQTSNILSLLDNLLDERFDVHMDFQNQFAYVDGDVYVTKDLLDIGAKLLLPAPTVHHLDDESYAREFSKPMPRRWKTGDPNVLLTDQVDLRGDGFQPYIGQQTNVLELLDQACNTDLCQRQKAQRKKSWYQKYFGADGKFRHAKSRNVVDAAVNVESSAEEKPQKPASGWKRFKNQFKGARDSPPVQKSNKIGVQQVASPGLWTRFMNRVKTPFQKSIRSKSSQSQQW
ncbi:hypothetical protein MIR68_007301 [Amoeboaphelidium protococcarum]|nr:hypothetical protein MIR68_007301 [Amoeboaphelidium protococcarum]